MNLFAGRNGDVHKENGHTDTGEGEGRMNLRK